MESSSIFTFMPCQREIALNGLSALSVRKLLNAVRFELPSTAKLTTDTCTSMRYMWSELILLGLTITMMKSRQVQTLPK